MLPRELKGIESGAFSVDGKLLVGLKRGKQAVVLDIDSGATLNEFSVMSNTSSVTFSPDGSRLLFIDTSGRMSMRTGTGAELWNRSSRDAHEGHDPVWVPSGNQFVRSDNSKRLRLHDATTGSILIEVAVNKVPRLVPRDQETFILTHSLLSENLHSIIEVRRFNTLEMVNSIDLGENLGPFGVDPGMKHPWFIDWDEHQNSILHLNGQITFQGNVHVDSLSFHPSGEEFSVVLSDSRAQRYRTEDLSLIQEVSLPFAHRSMYSPDGLRLAAFGWQGSVMLDL